MHEAFSISPLGDGALLLTFANRIDAAINDRVQALFHRLQNLSPFIYDVVPAYSSLAIYYNMAAFRTKNKTAFTAVKELLLSMLNEEATTSVFTGRQITIPVCYANVFAQDIEALAAEKGLLTEEIIRLHTAKNYRVYMLGFLPGFAYMGTVDERLATPRKAVPRANIPAGSVGIAGNQTGIYPLESPGGWNIIGQTPVQLFDKDKEVPVLLQPGDTVRFYSITKHEFENYQEGPS